MNIEVSWLSEEKRILHILYHTNWTWEDFEAHRQQAQALVSHVPDKISVIIEYDRDASLLPANALHNLSHAAETASQQVDLVLMVMPSQFWRVVISLLKRLMPHSVFKNNYIVPSRQAALEFIENYYVKRSA